jgi:hypothetical protein
MCSGTPTVLSCTQQRQRSQWAPLSQSNWTGSDALITCSTTRWATARSAHLITDHMAASVDMHNSAMPSAAGPAFAQRGDGDCFGRKDARVGPAPLAAWRRKCQTPRQRRAGCKVAHVRAGVDQTTASLPSAASMQQTKVSSLCGLQRPAAHMCRPWCWHLRGPAALLVRLGEQHRGAVQRRDTAGACGAGAGV